MERMPKLSRLVVVTVAGALTGTLLIPCWPGHADASVRQAAAPAAICRSSSHPALAARISSDIQAARRGRVSSVAVAVDAPAAGLTCSLTVPATSTRPAW